MTEENISPNDPLASYEEEMNQYLTTIMDEYMDGDKAMSYFLVGALRTLHVNDPDNFNEDSEDIEEVLESLGAIFARWFYREKAEAWSEGYNVSDELLEDDNPYLLENMEAQGDE